MSTVLMPFETTGSVKGIPIVLVPRGLSSWVSCKTHAEILCARAETCQLVEAGLECVCEMDDAKFFRKPK